MELDQEAQDYFSLFFPADLSAKIVDEIVVLVEENVLVTVKFLLFLLVVEHVEEGYYKERLF